MNPSIDDLNTGESIRYDHMTIIRVSSGFNYLYFDPTSGAATSAMFIPDSLVYPEFKPS